MGRYSTCPMLLDDTLQISISKLKQFGYICPETNRNGILHWSVNEDQFASISISISMYDTWGTMELDYRVNGEPVNYIITIISVPSNIGNGRVFYFECPETNKLCRKLYKTGRYFLHREACNMMYESQTYSRKQREENRVYEILYAPDYLFMPLYQRYLKKTYAGKPTKKYLRLINKIPPQLRHVIEK
jgi:hypothetical protein